MISLIVSELHFTLAVSSRKNSRKSNWKGSQKTAEKVTGKAAKKTAEKVTGKAAKKNSRKSKLLWS
jgi:hypothetical protein